MTFPPLFPSCFVSGLFVVSFSIYRIFLGGFEVDYLRLKQAFCFLASEVTTFWSFLEGGGDTEKLLDFWAVLGVFLSTAVLFVCDVLRQIILSFGGSSGRSEDLSPFPALPILPKTGSFLPQIQYSY